MNNLTATQKIDSWSNRKPAENSQIKKSKTTVPLPTAPWPKDGDQVKIPVSQERTVTFAPVVEFIPIKIYAKPLLNDAPLPSNVAANVKIKKFTEQQMTFFNLKKEFLEESLHLLPINWTKTGKDQHSFEIIAERIVIAIQSIQNFKQDSLNPDWTAEEESRLNETFNAIVEAEDMVFLSNHWKDTLGGATIRSD